jgi:hypothetical protein
MLVVVDKPGAKLVYLLSRSLPLQGTRRMPAWKQRHWSEQRFRLLKHLVAAEAGPARRADTYDGPFVWRLIAGVAWFSTSRCIFKGHVPMEEIVFTLKHHWMTVDYEPFELYGIA